MNAVHSSRFALVIAIALVAAACVNEPVKTAQTAEQKAYAIESEYNILLGDALQLVRDPQVPAALRARVQSAVARASMVVQQLDTAMDEAMVERQKLTASGLTKDSASVDKIEALANNVRGWVAEAEKAVANLKGALKASPQQ